MGVCNGRCLIEVNVVDEGEGEESGDIGDEDEDVEVVEVFVSDGEEVDEETS